MGLNCMLDKKRKKNNVQKIHFQMFWHVLLFLLCYWTAILVVVRPSLLKEGGHKESYGELSIFFSFYFRWDGVSVLFSCKRESLAFTFLFLLFLDSDKSIVRAVFAAHAVRSVSAPVFATVHLSSVYIHSKLYMLVFIFFSNKRPWTLSCLTSFFLCLIVKMIYKDSITSLYVVYRLDKCVNNKWL